MPDDLDPKYYGATLSDSAADEPGAVWKLSTQWFNYRLLTNADYVVLDDFLADASRYYRRTQGVATLLITRDRAGLFRTKVSGSVAQLEGLPGIDVGGPVLDVGFPALGRRSIGDSSPWWPGNERPTAGPNTIVRIVSGIGTGSSATVDTPVTQASVEAFTEAVVDTLEEEPIEDGVHHPAEALMERALRQGEWSAADAIQSLYNGNTDRRPILAAGLLRCLGRLRVALVEPWGPWLATGALQHHNVVIRTAGVRALEMWGGDDAVRSLRERYPKEIVQWLARYMQKVVEDLTR